MAARRHKRYLIVNADDFGQSSGVNRGIMEAHERGIVTSASLMVRWPSAVEAAAYGRLHAKFSLGLHFDFGEWAYRRGRWLKLYGVVPEDDRMAVAEEAARQLGVFRDLVGRDPTHLDSHQHVHRKKALRPIFLEIARGIGVPLRSCTPQIRYCGDFYGQTTNGRTLPSLIAVNALSRIFGQLRPGFTELGCHPGEADDLDSMYQTERAQEVKTLCNPRLRTALFEMGIELCNFSDLSKEHHGNGNAFTGLIKREVAGCRRTSVHQ